MTITKRTVHRTISEEEMVRLKNTEPFAQFRQDSKAINFGMIFGISYRKFSSASLETSWSYDRIHTFIIEKGLEDRIELMQEKNPNVDSKLWEYYVVADYIRTSFFETYPGLMNRIKRNEQFAKDNGYIRSFHGVIRRTPMLMFCMHEVTNKWGNEVMELRKDENKREIANLVNITSNSTIQTDESTVVNTMITKWNNVNSIEHYAIGTVHDSVDFYIKKSEAKELLPKMKEVFELKGENWQRGLYFPVDLTIIDLKKSDDYYKHGTSYKKFMEAQK